MIIIGISGKKGSGKDTFASLLANELLAKRGLKVTLKAFADKLKQCCAILSNQHEWNFYSQDCKNKKAGFLSMTNRELMQKFGDLTRQIDPDIWIKLALDINNVNTDVLIITDVRFKNEAKAIKDRGGILIRMESDRSEEDTHISEIDLDSYNIFDFGIINNKDTSLGILQEQIKNNIIPKIKWSK